MYVRHRVAIRLDWEVFMEDNQRTWLAQWEARDHAFHVEFEEDDRRLITHTRLDRVLEEMLRCRWVPDRFSKMLEIKTGKCVISLTKIQGAEFGAFVRKSKKSEPNLGLE